MSNISQRRQCNAVDNTDTLFTSLPSHAMQPLKRQFSQTEAEEASQPNEPDARGPSQRRRLDDGSSVPVHLRSAPLTIAYPDVSQPNAPVRQTPFQRPTQIMSYSHDATHAQKFDNSAMRYYVDPPKGARLDYGYDRWIRKPDERGRLDGLLNAFREIKVRGGVVPDNGVVSWRGVMTK